MISTVDRMLNYWVCVQYVQAVGVLPSSCYWHPTYTCTLVWLSQLWVYPSTNPNGYCLILILTLNLTLTVTLTLTHSVGKFSGLTCIRCVYCRSHNKHLPATIRVYMLCEYLHAKSESLVHICTTMAEIQNFSRRLFFIGTFCTWEHWQCWLAVSCLYLLLYNSIVLNFTYFWAFIFCLHIVMYCLDRICYKWPVTAGVVKCCIIHMCSHLAYSASGCVCKSLNWLICSLCKGCRYIVK